MICSPPEPNRCQTSRLRPSRSTSATIARTPSVLPGNLLGTVQATVKLSNADTPEGVKQAIEGRIRALADVHSLFAETRWIGAELSLIATQELAPYSEEQGTRLQVEGPKVLLEPNTAQAAAMILHELTTNAAKYGALSTPSGRIDLKWSHEPSGELHLRWTETGGPTIRAPKRRGFRARIIEQLAAQQEGKALFKWRAKGLVCEITLLMRAS
jgi:two-component sensor histidine kinase